MGLATQKFGAKFFENGAILSGVLQTDGKLTEESAQRLRTSWNNRFGGVYKSHSTAVLEGGVNYKPISVPLVDAEFVKNRSFTISEIARIFRVQPHMIMDLERSTNNNNEQQSYTTIKKPQKHIMNINNLIEYCRSGREPVRAHGSTAVRIHLSPRVDKTTCFHI